MNSHVLIDLKKPGLVIKLAKNLLRKGVNDLIFETQLSTAIEENFDYKLCLLLVDQ